MRENKFRGKRKIDGKWVYGYLIGTDVIVGEIVEFSDEYFNTEFWYKVDPKTVGQSTGLKDKNGKEIYEGDILESNHKLFRFEVIWSEDWAMFTVKGDSVEALIRWDTYCEVIGNIYENPELLKGEETA